MKIEYIKNPVFSNADNTAIDCIVKFAEIAEELPFNAMASDNAAHGREAFERLIAGEFGPIGLFVEQLVMDADQPQPISQGTQAL